MMDSDQLEVLIPNFWARSLQTKEFLKVRVLREVLMSVFYVCVQEPINVRRRVRYRLLMTCRRMNNQLKHA
jgi:hypothetical protein